jgi:hypothetical protein
MCGGIGDRGADGYLCRAAVGLFRETAALSSTPTGIFDSGMGGLTVIATECTVKRDAYVKVIQALFVSVALISVVIPGER